MALIQSKKESKPLRKSDYQYMTLQKQIINPPCIIKKEEYSS